MSRATSSISIALIEENKTKPKQLRAVAATRRSMDEITAALQHRPVLFFPDLTSHPRTFVWRCPSHTHPLTLSYSNHTATSGSGGGGSGGFDRHPRQFFAGRLLLLYTSDECELALLRIFSRSLTLLGYVSFISIIICLLLVRRGE